MVTGYRHVERITPSHLAGEFDCGSPDQTEWLKQFGLESARSNSSQVYVVCPAGEDRIAGYYALAAGSVARDEAPGRVTAGIGRYPVPIILLTRLGVDLRDQGRGLGKGLLRDALIRVDAISREVGVRALLIHAESEAAKAFYMGLAEFEVSPTDDLHLFLHIKDLRRTVDSL